MEIKREYCDKLTENDKVVISASIRNKSEKAIDIIIDNIHSDEEITNAYIGITKGFVTYLYESVGMRDKRLFKMFIIKHVNLLMDVWNEVVATSDKKDEVDELIDKLMNEVFGDKK